MASGESYLATLPTPLCCNVTPTCLITHHSTSLSLFSLPHFGSPPIFSPLAFPFFRSLASSVLFLPSSLSCVISVIDTVQEIYSAGNPWGNTRRNECQGRITRDAYRYIVLKFSSVQHTCCQRGLVGIMTATKHLQRKIQCKIYT